MWLYLILALIILVALAAWWDAAGYQRKHRSLQRRARRQRPKDYTSGLTTTIPIPEKDFRDGGDNAK